MVFCTQCGVSLPETSPYCSKCGARNPPPESTYLGPGTQEFYRPLHIPGPTTARGFGQAFGLDPRVAFLTLVVDLMLNAGEIASMGLLLPVSVGAGIVLGYITYKTQLTWYGDDKESAKLKAVILALLTAIPTALPAILYIPSGLLGLYHNARRRISQS